MQLPVPLPKEYTIGNRYKAFNPIVDFTAPIFSDSCAAFEHTAGEIFGCSEKSAEPNICLKLDTNLPAEAYTIDVKDEIIIKAADTYGAAHAFSSIIALAEYRGDKLCLPCPLHISDRPDKEWRGMMIDLARKWHTFEQLKKYVDLCYLYRLNRLHLHFMDDQGYRLPSKAFPKLPSDGQSYTFEQISALNSYAEQRGVMIVPEIEMPGHAKSLLHAYPELFANADHREDDNLICVGKEGVYDSIDTLIGEVCEMFEASPYIHIGGDEASIDYWTWCGDCKNYMSRNNIHDVHELYSHFIAKATSIVIKHGRTPIVWEGFPAVGAENIPKQTLVMEFESRYQLTPELLEEGFRVINTSWVPLYIVPDHHWSDREIYEWNTYEWRNWWEKSAAYEHPICVAPTARVPGAQLCAWECDFAFEMPIIKESIGAFSERLWNENPRLTFEQFSEQANYMKEKADKLIH